VIGRKLSYTSHKQSLFDLACTIFPFSLYLRPRPMLHSLHATISPLVSNPHNIGSVKPSLYHRITFHLSRGLSFASAGRIYISTAPPATLLSDNISQYSRSLYHRAGEGRGYRPFPLVSIYIPVISTQLSVGVPSSHRFADFLPR
jgi:hypothetical protein